MPGSEPRLANGVGLGGHDASAMAIVHLCRGAVYPFEAKGQGNRVKKSVTKA
jgi:hypothetical protein